MVLGPLPTGLAARTLSARSQGKILKPNVSPVLVLVPQTTLRPNTRVHRPHNLGRRQRLTIHTNTDVPTNILIARDLALVTARLPNKSAHAALKVLKQLVKPANIRCVHHRFLTTVEESEALGAGGTGGFAICARTTGHYARDMVQGPRTEGQGIKKCQEWSGMREITAYAGFLGFY